MQESWEPGGEPSEAERIALAALEVAEGARALFVEAACAGDPILAEAVRDLLEEFTESETWFRQVATRSGALLEASGGFSQEVGHPEPPESVPVALGPYQVLETLGRGGMGAVYLAEREDRDFRMRVAVKVLHAHLASPPFRSRFLSEQRILARLSHPGIARLIDGGVLDNGTPYLVMEFVEGEDLVTWANARKLGLRARVELFQQVCRAVAYAHRNLVVHRDLKPSNTRVTADGEVKLLDFGIARVLDSVDEDEGEITRLHPFSGIPLTPRYASPEQMRGEAIGTPSDVYSMGILLRNLLRSPGGASRSGSETSSGSQASSGAQERSGAAPRATSASRAGEPPPLPSGLPDDLVAILEKAARPEPEARYGSAEELGDDLARFLDGRPVMARTGSTRYRLRKLVARHRWATAAAGIAFLAALGGGAGLVAHSARVEAERDLAQLETERAEAVTAFLLDLFDVAGEGTAMDTVRAGTLLHTGEARLRERLDAHPEVRASLLLALSSANGRLGVFGAPERLLEERVEVLRDHHGPDHPAVAGALIAAGERRVASRHWTQADSLLQEGLRILELQAPRRLLEPDHRKQKASALGSLALTLRHLELPDSAVAVGRAAMALDREAAARDEELIPVLNSLASALRGAGELDGAEALLREALEVLERAEDPLPRNQSLILNNLASLLRLRGEMGEAEARFRAALEVERGLSGDDSQATETVASNLRNLLVAMERFEEADALAMAWDSIIQVSHPPDHWRIGRARMRRAEVWVGAGECGRALPLIREGGEIYTRALGPEHQWTVQSHVVLAECLVALGRTAEAEPLLSNALPIMISAPNPNTNFIELAAELLSAIHLAEGRTAEAEGVRALEGR